MDYAAAVEYIKKVRLLGPALGLERVGELLRLLDNPQKTLKIIHVAGTNGKGSAIAMMAAVLRAAGYKTGVYTSPHIMEVMECIAINTSPISERDFAGALKKVKAACDKMVGAGGQHPTEFEVVTALALLYFAENMCDVVLLEVGLGGRLDATNVIESPIACVLTSISLDHMDKLGSTLTEIAREKCGIVKSARPVVSYHSQADEVWRVIGDTAKEKRAPLYVSPPPKILKTSLEGTYFDCGEYENLFIPLLGVHQPSNAAVALTVLNVLRDRGFLINESHIRDGLSRARWGGRFELIGRNPDFVIDGAHNFAGIEVFKASLTEYFSGRSLIFIMGMLSDKEYERSLRLIAPMAREFIAVTVPNPRTLPAEALAEIAKKYARAPEKVHVAKSVEDAVKTALSLCPKNGVIAAFGSLYLLGDVKNSLKNVDFAI